MNTSEIYNENIAYHMPMKQEKAKSFQPFPSSSFARNDQQYGRKALSELTNQMPTNNNNNKRISDDEEIVKKDNYVIERKKLCENDIIPKGWKTLVDNLANLTKDKVSKCHWDGFYVVEKRSGEPDLKKKDKQFDLILRTWYKKGNQKFITTYLAHKDIAAFSNRGSGTIARVLEQSPDTVEIDIQLHEMCAAQMKHVLLYMYSGRVRVDPNNLVPLFALVDRLKMKGDLAKSLRREIKTSLLSNKVWVDYLLQSELTNAEKVLGEIRDMVLARWEEVSVDEWSIVPLESFSKLVTRGVSHSPHSVMKMIVRYLSIVSSSSPEHGRRVVEHLCALPILAHHIQAGVTECIDFVKLVDGLLPNISCKERRNRVLLYEVAINQLETSFSPFDPDHMILLGGLHGDTFLTMLTNANHLKQDALCMAVSRFKGANGTSGEDEPVEVVVDSIIKARPSVVDDCIIDEAIESVEAEKEKSVEKTHIIPVPMKPVNKAHLVETIEKYHSGCAKLVKDTDESADANSSGHSPQSTDLFSSRRGRSGGANCVECHQWRHKFAFTKSQWRNRPRGFRRCKHCTGEIGSDSRMAPNEQRNFVVQRSPKRYRQVFK